MQIKKSLCKKIIICFLILAISIGTLCACSINKNSAKEKSYTGIISAMDNEIQLLLNEAEIDHVDTIGNVEFHVGKLNGKPVVITRAGIGKVLAASE